MSLTTEERFALERYLKELNKRTKGNLIKTYFPEEGEFARNKYAKHLEFFEAGESFHQRLFMAANRIGKTEGGAYELACHLTGEYPEWWVGKRFDSANHWWVCGVDSKTIIATTQTKLLGPIGDFGTGMIPRDKLDPSSLTNATKPDTMVAGFRVKHKNGGFSLVEFKSYESGRASFQGAERNIWLDEEPKEDIYAECLARTATKGCILFMTFTPLYGLTPLITNFCGGDHFVEGPLPGSKYVVNATWDDVPHISEEVKTNLLLSFPPYQRDARSKGIPQLGSGAIFPIGESEIVVAPFELPKHWKKHYGMDVGWNRTAVTWFATDPDSNVSYLFSEHYQGEQTPSLHAQTVHARGKWIPGVIDPASRGRTQTDGEQLMQTYKDLGLILKPANNAVEAGLWEMLEGMQSGKFKVFSTCTNWLKEFRTYQRDVKGKVVKTNDHAMDASRYGWMSRDIALNEQQTKPKQVLNAGVPSKRVHW